MHSRAQSLEREIMWAIHSFNKCLLSTYMVPGTPVSLLMGPPTGQGVSGT